MRGERCEDAVCVQPIGSCEEREMRLILHHITRQHGIGSDVRRVSEDKIEALVDALKPVANSQLGPI